MYERKVKSMVFHGSFFEAIKDMPAEEFKKCACAILEYGLCGKEVETGGVERVVFSMAKPIIDSANLRYKNCVENGKKGGRPKKNNQTGLTNKNQNALDYENLNDNVNVNDNVNDNDNVNVDVNDNVNENEYVNEKENAPFGRKGKMPLHTRAFGEYKNVFLTKSEQDRLLETLGEERFSESVTFLSRYIKRKPAFTSASHFEDIRGWVQDAVDERKGPSPHEFDSKQGTGSSSFDFDLSEIFERP